MSGITIAIDGYSSCGKSTLAKEIAKELNYVYVDSGAMYRALTLHLVQNNILSEGKFELQAVLNELDNIEISFSYQTDSAKSVTMLNDQNVEDDIRTARISSEVSAISAIPEVREKLVLVQQDLGSAGSVVMDGRDIGTVVFPDADIKIFMTASVHVRARRRYDERREKGENVSLSEIEESIIRRDDLDVNREISPLKKADDAHEMEKSNLSKKEQFEIAMNLIYSKIGESS